jgi:hypothetical protein
MTKLTRQQLFYKAFGLFMENKMSNLYYEITAHTENKQKNTQHYTITFPHAVEAGAYDRTVNGVLTEETIYHTQWMPTADCMVKEFNHYFDYYCLYDPNNSGIRLSYMLIRPDALLEEEENTEDDENRPNKYKITIIYYKTHKPFPANDFSNTEANNEILELKSTIRMLEETQYNYQRRISHLRDILHDERIRRKETSRKLHTVSYDNHSRMENHIRGMFKAYNIEHECPVCYEQLESDKLAVPSCCHYICTTCLPKCTSCPLCRENYDNYILSTHAMPAV